MMSRLTGPASVFLPVTPYVWRAKVALAQHGQGGFQDQTQMGKNDGNRSLELLNLHTSFLIYPFCLILNWIKIRKQIRKTNK